MKGIDVSKWNGNIDWARVKNTDVGYAIIRCGFGDNLAKQDDTYWERNVNECEKYNIPYGVYIYSYATTVKQAKSEAAHVLRMIKGRRINFPIYLDVEDNVQKKLPKKTLTSIIQTFLNEISSKGYECGVYASLNWWYNYIGSEISGNQLWHKWVAQWNNECTYTGKYQMWQATSDGEVEGINGRVDLNFWFGSARTRSYDITVKQNTTIKAPKPVKPPKRAAFKSVKKGKKGRVYND